MLGRHFQRQQKRIDEDYAEIAKHVQEMKCIKQQIHDLQTKYASDDIGQLAYEQLFSYYLLLVCLFSVV
jgi:hypothetical protein